MQLADALSHCLVRVSQEIKLDMQVDYIAFTKPWIEKLKDSMQRDPILAMVYQLTQQGWPHQRRHIPHLVRRYWDFRDKLSTGHTGLECIEVSKVFRKLFLVIHSNLFHYPVPSGPLYISCNSCIACRQSLFFQRERGISGYHAYTDHHQGRGQSSRPTAPLINIH